MLLSRCLRLPAAWELLTMLMISRYYLLQLALPLGTLAVYVLFM